MQALWVCLSSVFPAKASGSVNQLISYPTCPSKRHDIFRSRLDQRHSTRMSKQPNDYLPVATNPDQKPDFNSYHFRQERFRFAQFPFCPAQKDCALPTAPGKLPNTNDQAELSDEGVLKVQLFDRSHDTGFHVDSVIGNVLIPWLRLLPADNYRRDTLACLFVALWRLDQRSVAKHGFKESPSEQNYVPPKKYLPSLEAWIDCWKRAQYENTDDTFHGQKDETE